MDIDSHPEPPAERPAPSLTLDQAQKAQAKYWRSPWLKQSHYNDARYSIDREQHYRYELKPPSTMLACGTLGTLLIVGQMFVPYKVWMHSTGDFTGLIRMAMFFGGAICIFMAWPRHRDVRSSDAEEAETEAFREHISRKKYRW